MKLMLYSHVVFVQRITYSVKRKVMVLTSYVIVVVLSDYNLFQTIIYLHKVLMVYKRVQFICPISLSWCWIIYICSIYYHSNNVFKSIMSIFQKCAYKCSPAITLTPLPIFSNSSCGC